jgi:hypothetical protein
MFQIRLFSLAVLLTSLFAFQTQAQWATTVTGTVNLSAPNSTLNVGIGTQNTPARSKLDVIGTTIFQGNSSIIGTSLVQGNATVTGTSRLNGKVGINGAPGVEMLEVGGNIRSKGHIFINPSFNLTTTGVITQNATITGTILSNYLKSNNFMMPTGAGASKVLTSDELGNATWQPLPTQIPSQWTNNTDGTGISYDKNIGVAQNLAVNGSSYLTGQVGIGTTDPNPFAQLHVKGKTNAAGWYGLIIASGNNASVLLGEYQSKAVIGGGNGVLDSWGDLYLNPNDKNDGSPSNVGIGVLPSNTITERLEVNGNVKATSFIDGSGTTLKGSQWTTNPDNSISYGNGSVGIGTTSSPQAKLHVSNGSLKVDGNATITGALIVNGKAITPNGPLQKTSSVSCATDYNNCISGHWIPQTCNDDNGDYDCSYYQCDQYAQVCTDRYSLAGQLDVTGRLKLGTGSLYATGITNIPGGPTRNEIYGDNGTFYINSNAGNTQNTILNQNGGYIGIGMTPSTSNKLQVNGDIGLEGSSKLKLGNNTGEYIYSNRSLGDIRFASGFQERMVLTNGGYVGIGTTSPNAKLEVAGNGGQSVDLIVNGRIKSSSGDGGLWAGNGFIGAFENGNKVGLWNQDWHLVVQNNGYVGIGTTTPAERLEVNGNIKANAIKFPDGSTLNSANALGGNEISKYKINLVESNGGDNTDPMAFYRVNNGYNSSELRLLLGDDLNTSNDKFTIGVNNSAANGAWKSFFSLNTKGELSVRKVIVTQNGWSDNVFDSTYKLSSLQEVEDYIKANKHLPNIPSEKTIVEQGLDTGEMLKLQMAKIEELTLHLIAQQKEIEALKAKLK